jgi:transcriptional regulator with XRE-family HTH domain
MSVTLAEQIGQNVRNAREDADLTQVQLAKLAGVSRATIAKTEAGDIIPRADNLKAVADALGVSTDYLMRVPTHSKPFLPYLKEFLGRHQASLTAEDIAWLRSIDTIDFAGGEPDDGTIFALLAAYRSTHRSRI